MRPIRRSFESRVRRSPRRKRISIGTFRKTIWRDSNWCTPARVSMPRRMKFRGGKTYELTSVKSLYCTSNAIEKKSRNPNMADFWPPLAAGASLQRRGCGKSRRGRDGIFARPPCEGDFDPEWVRSIARCALRSRPRPAGHGAFRCAPARAAEREILIRGSRELPRNRPRAIPGRAVPPPV